MNAFIILTNKNLSNIANTQKKLYKHCYLSWYISKRGIKRDTNRFFTNSVQCIYFEAYFTVISTHGDVIIAWEYFPHYWPLLQWIHPFNTLRRRQNGRHFPDDIFKCIFLNETVWISIQISLKFVPKVPINNIPALVQIMVWRRPGDKPLSEAMMVSLLTYICVTRPQWVKVEFHHKRPEMQCFDGLFYSIWLSFKTNSWLAREIKCIKTHVMSP